MEIELALAMCIIILQAQEFYGRNRAALQYAGLKMTEHIPWQILHRPEESYDSLQTKVNHSTFTDMTLKQCL